MCLQNFHSSLWESQDSFFDFFKSKKQGQFGVSLLGQHKRRMFAQIYCNQFIVFFEVWIIQ